MRYIDWKQYLNLNNYLNKKKLELIREKDNKNDLNAISVHLKNFGKLGYIKRSISRLLSPTIDNNGKIECQIFKRYYPQHEIDTTMFLRLKQS